MVLVLTSGTVTNAATSGPDKTLEIVVYVDNVATAWKQQVQLPANTSRPWLLLGSLSLPGGGPAHDITVKASVTSTGAVSVGPNGSVTVTALP
jgi:hypothetical protein